MTRLKATFMAVGLATLAGPALADSHIKRLDLTPQNWIDALLIMFDSGFLCPEAGVPIRTSNKDLRDAQCWITEYDDCEAIAEGCMERVQALSQIAGPSQRLFGDTIRGTEALRDRRVCICPPSFEHAFGE